jgi:hypothetical protein
VRWEGSGWSGLEGASDGCEEGSGWFSSMSHSRGLGRGDWGSIARRQGRSTGTAMWARVYGNRVGHSSLDFTEICPPGV